MAKKGNQKPKIAYFCMEFGLHEEFYEYSGGLGVLAGDILKAAHDLEIPMVGVGILWKQGYTKQLIGEDGRPYDCYPTYRYDFLEDMGVTVTVQIAGDPVQVKVWKTERYGNVPLYLLDTNLPDNPRNFTTSQLYGGGGDARVAQEIVLGVGGVLALQELGLDIDIYHFNDGHPAFAGLELIRQKMDQGMAFADAFAETRKEIVFTTHTPVVAGNESHPIERLLYLGANCGLTIDELVHIGGSPFNMTVACLRMSFAANAVAQLHGETARDMWSHVKDAAPIISITNGVHHGTWVDPRIQENLAHDADLWNAHMEIKRECVDFIKERTGVQLDADKLLIGFARRAAPYKRSDLLFRDPEVIEPYLKEGKIQIVFSGKAHPLDDDGKEIISNLIRMTKKYPKSVVFIENYDMAIGKMLTRGVDIWLNNPRRPMEASGTSGMKAAMNGIMNCSTLDGWWPEACEHGVNGWQFGDAYVGEGQDEHDLRALYRVLLEEVVPTYYGNRDKWIQMMRASVKSSYEQFSAARMVQQYWDLIYTRK